MTDPFHDLTRLAPDELASEAGCAAALDAAEALSPLPAEDDVRARLPEKGMTVGFHRLLARVVEARGDAAEGDRLLLALAERINQEGFWTALARVAALLLVRHPREAAPLLARARARGGAAAVSDELLEEAHRAFPRHGLLTWQLAEALLAAGREAEAKRLAAHALPELVSDKSYELAEEALLLVVGDPHPEIQDTLVRVVELLGRQEAWTELATCLDLAPDLLTSSAGAPRTWPVLRELWLRHPERDDLRKAALRTARTLLEAYPDPAAMVRIAEIDRPSLTPEAILERMDRTRRFPPGYFARHAAWGFGLLRDNDTEQIVVDFATKPLHRMTWATADKALTVYPPDDLRVAIATRPEAVAELASAERAALLVQALRTFPEGQATGEEIRRLLVPAVLAAPAWAAWWKAAKTEATASADIDTTRAYENVFRLPRAGDATDAVPLPEWAGGSVLDNLALLDGFAAHHAAEVPRLLEAVRDRVRDAAERAPRPEERVAAALWLVRYEPGCGLSPAAGVTGAFDIEVFSREDQSRLLAHIDHAQGWGAALGSRAPAVRGEAWERLKDDPEAGGVALAILADARTRPEAALHLLGLEPDAAAVLGLGDWGGRALLALLDLVEHPPRDTHRKRAMTLTEPDSALARTLRASPIPEALESEVSLRLKRWEGSDRYRFPLLDLLKQTGHEEIVNRVEGHRARAAARVGSRIGSEDEPYGEETLLTRPTLDRLQTERHRVGMELKTTIPAAIKKARELGDLRENAEYESAKAKQRNYAKRFEELGRLLERVRLIESVTREPGVALPGTEVRLLPLDAEPTPISLWLLGEGDQDLGERVVSYRAPVGQALTGKRVGEEVTLPWGDAPQRYRIEEVRERLP